MKTKSRVTASTTGFRSKKGPSANPSPPGGKPRSLSRSAASSTSLEARPFQSPTKPSSVILETSPGHPHRLSQGASPATTGLAAGKIADPSRLSVSKHKATACLALLEVLPKLGPATATGHPGFRDELFGERSHNALTIDLPPRGLSVLEHLRSMETRLQGEKLAAHDARACLQMEAGRRKVR